MDSGKAKDYFIILRKALRRNGNGNAELEIADIVIMKEESTPQAFWKLGSIEEIILSQDNRAKYRTFT